MDELNPARRGLIFGAAAASALVAGSAFAQTNKDAERTVQTETGPN